ncbi:hypothetical protein FRC04_007361 [Tulasnella sp. 424]|nr:hypothetical protein FRC04_007361 [Tulasnella sp. 424]KAG8971593.1 hypothetical protein FRC05_010939 [Tulasnella sp. 425]
MAFAYQKYLDDTPEGKKTALKFKRTFSISVPIEFVGVWWVDDIVLYIQDQGTKIGFAQGYRGKHWLVVQDPNAAKHDPEGGTAILTSAKDNQLPGTVRGWLTIPKQVLSAIFSRGPVDAGGDDVEDQEDDVDDDYQYHHGKPTEVEEVWFAGCHSDVGGGSTPNNAIHTLANPSLKWMVSRVLKYVPCILFRPDAFTYDKAFLTLTVTKSDLHPKPARPRIPSTFRRAAGDVSPFPSPQPTPLPPLTADTAGSFTLNGMVMEEEQTVYEVQQTDPATDANADKHDELIKSPGWLILEVIPIFQYYQDGEGVWHWRFRWNRRRGREIYCSTPKFHTSVQLRSNYEGKWLTKFYPKPGEQVKIEYVE